MFRKFWFGIALPALATILVTGAIVILLCPRPEGAEPIAWRGIYYFFVLLAHTVSGCLVVSVLNLHILVGPLRSPERLMMIGAIPMTLACAAEVVGFCLFPDAMMGWVDLFLDWLLRGPCSL